MFHFIKGRAFVSHHDVSRWFTDVGKFIQSKSELQEAMKDPRRVFNQDETSIEHGMSDQYVITMKGDKQVYGVSSSNRDHTTISFTVNAAGWIVSPRVIFPGVRDMAKSKLKLPNYGKTGEWQYTYTSNGWVKQEIYLDIIQEL